VGGAEDIPKKSWPTSKKYRMEPGAERIALILGRLYGKKELLNSGG